MHKIGTVRIVGLTLALVLPFLASVYAVDATVVSVDPATQNVAAGQTFTVDVAVDNVTEMTTDGAYLHFDSAAMQALGVTEGLTSGNPHLVTIETIDNTNGEVVFTYSITNNVSGSGALVTIQFRADQNANGTYPLNLTDVELYNETGLIPLGGINNGSVNITGREIPPRPEGVPVFSSMGVIAVISLLAFVLAVSVGTSRRRRRD